MCCGEDKYSSTNVQTGHDISPNLAKDLRWILFLVNKFYNHSENVNIQMLKGKGVYTEVYSESSQTSKKKFNVKTGNGFQQLTNFAKTSILNVGKVS